MYTETAAIGLIPLGDKDLLTATLVDFEAPLALTLLQRTHPPHECSVRRVK